MPICDRTRMNRAPAFPLCDPQSDTFADKETVGVFSLRAVLHLLHPVGEAPEIPNIEGLVR